MQIFFSAGEPSGDIHGANLIRALRAREPDIECVGFGGPRMAAAGCRLHADLTQLAVMWFLQVFLNLRQFWNWYREAAAWFRTNRPDAVVLIDFPGFNWWIASAARRQGIPVFYYGVPQLWAWGGWRIRKLQRWVDYLLCKLPFEEAWYRQRGCEARYVGHPFFDETRGHRLDLDFVRRQRDDAGPLVSILPGSRTQEVRSNLPSFLRAARQLRQDVPQVRFAVAAFNDRQAAIARDVCRRERVDAAVFVGRTPELIEAAKACMACSGSVSLELLDREKPTVILYKISRFAHFVQGFFRRVRYITLVNLLETSDPFCRPGTTFDPDAPNAEQVPFPEYLTYGDRAREMARHIQTWLQDPAAGNAKRAQLRRVKRDFAVPGASSRAAQFILDQLHGRSARRRAG